MIPYLCSTIIKTHNTLLNFHIMTQVQNTVEQFEANGSIYKYIHMKVSGSIFSFMKVSGKNNYVSIRKITNNPHGAFGKEFATWADAENNYKSPAMQIALLFAAEQLDN